jgi:hypothetical protein
MYVNLYMFCVIYMCVCVWVGVWLEARLNELEDDKC